MSEENEIMVKPKLNFFQRLRKNNLIKKVNIDKYEKAPEYLKHDEEVILALIFQNPNNILKFPMEKRLQVLQTKPEFFDVLPTSEKYSIIVKEPSFINRLESNDMLAFISKNENTEFIKYLPEEIQIDLLTKENKFYEITETYTGNYTTNERSLEPVRFSKKLDCFSSDVIEKVTIMLINKAQQSKRYSSWEDKRRTEPLLANMDISILPIDKQLRLGLLDVEFLKSMSEEAVKKYIGSNPLLMKNLSSDMQVKIIRDNPQMLSCLPYNVKYNILKSDYTLRNIALDEDKADCFFGDAGLTNTKIIKEKLAKMSYRDGMFTSKLVESLRDPKDLIDIGQFEPLTFNHWGDRASAYRKVGHINDLYKSFIHTPEIIAELDKFQQNSINMSNLDRNNITTGFAKLLLNETIMNKVDNNLIVEFMKNPKDGELLKNIVEQAYGKKARKVLEARPNVTLEQIPNFYIFDSAIFEKFGEGTVNNALSYDTSANCVLGELARRPDKLKKFEEFSRLFGEEKQDVVGFNNKLVAFENLEELLFNIDIKNLTEIQKNNLLLAYNDMFMDIKTNSGIVVPVKTLEDLDTYIDRRNKIYDDYFKKSGNETDIKDAISRRFFGMNYENRINSGFTHTDLSLNSMVHYYNLEEFTSDERTISSRNFSQDELDMLELAKIITNIHNPKILKEIYEELSQREDVLTPVDFAKTRDKVPMQYSKELVDSLLTVDKAKEKIKNGEQGISLKTTEDGIDIIKLNGADFRIMLHTTGLNNSGLQISRVNDLTDTWKNFEEGCSTISSCVIEPKMLRSCAIGGYTSFGFANIPEKQVVGMSHHDAHVAHAKRRVEPYFEYTSVMYNYPDELVRRTAAQITGQEQKDVTHEYNEVAMYRKYVDATKEDSYGKRVMPDYIVVYGEANDEHKRFAKSFAGANGKPIPIIEIDTKVYGDRTYQRGNSYSKENHKVERENGEVLQTVKETQNKDLEDER